MIIESKYTDVMLDGISTYIASTKLKKSGVLSFDECVKSLAESTGFDENDIAESFGEIIESALVDDSECQIDESFLDFLNEDENFKQAVDKAEKEQNGGQKDASAIDKHKTDDKNVGNGHNNRVYYAYCNFNEGKMFICSKLNQEEGAVANTFAKLGNFLATVTAPSFKGGILVAPISLDVARSLYAHKKVRYLDLTKEQANKQQQGQQQQQNQQQQKEQK
jgi:hypothetical protein